MSKKPTYEELEQRIRDLEKDNLKCRQEEAELRQSLEMFDGFLEKTPIFIFFKDKHIRSIKLSRNYEVMLSRPLEDLLGKEMDELFPSAIASSMISDDQKVLFNGKIVVVEEDLDGRFYTTTKFPIVIDGEAKYLAGHTIDITEQRKAEEAFRKSEAQLRERNEYIQTILDHLPIGLSVTKINAHQRAYTNKAFEKIYGWPAEEIKDIDVFFEKICPDPDYRKKLKTRIYTDLDSRDPARSQWENVEITTKDGSRRVVSIKNIPLLEQDLMISTVVDVTKRKLDEEEREKLQAQLSQVQKLESVGRLAGGVAHDFNNMLMVIFGYTELAMNSVSKDDPLYRVLQEILKAGKRSASVAQQLLAFARKQTIAPKVIDLNNMIEGTLKMLRRLIGEDISFAWIPGAGVWPVKIDPSQLDQILANLIVNARDAIANVGKITIETNTAVFDADYCANNVGFVPGEYSLLVVSDSGIGMDKETLENVFEPFFTTKSVGKGTGLGLATVYGIVKQNHGFINIYSEPGQGTTCKIYLPRYEGAEEFSQVIPSLRTVVKGNETILLVEDDPMILDISKILLEKLGYSVLAINTPKQAMDFAREYEDKIDLLMTDVIMPEMNGRDLAAKLLLINPKMKILFMSGYTANVIVHHGVLEKEVNFIQKPFGLMDLAEKLREVLDKS